MSTLLRPGRILVDRLSFTQKLLLLGGLFLVPLLILLKTVISSEMEVIEFATQERDGVQMILPLRELLQAAQGHRGTAQLVLGGKVEARAKLADFQAKAQEAIAKGDQIDQTAGTRLGTTATWKAIKTAWEETRNAALEGSQADSFARHTAFIDSLLAGITTVADASYLTLDPELVSYYLMDSMTVRLPRLAEAAGKLRGVGSGILTRGVVNQEEMVAVHLVLSQIREHNAALEGNLAKVFAASEGSKSSLAQATGQAKVQLDAFALLVEQEVLGKGKTGMEAAAFFAKGSAAVDAVYHLFDLTAPELDRKLDQRIADNQAKEVGNLVMLAVAMALIAYLFWSLRDGLMEAVHRVRDGSMRMLEGHLDEPFAVASKDELGSIGEFLDQMQSQLRTRIDKERAEAATNMRIRVALDSSAVGITISDDNASLVHMTPSARILLQGLQGAGGNVDGLIGTRLSALFTDPAAAERFDHAIVTGEEVDLVFNGRNLRLMARPIRDHDGHVLGRVTQWVDRTNEVAVEHAVANLVSAAAAGDFSHRLEESGKEGFFRQLATGINKLLETCETGMNDVAQVLKALADGDLTRRIDADYQGLFGQLKEDTNATSERLGEIVSQIREATDAINTASREIASGNADLSSRTESQASSLEETASSMDEFTSTVKQNADNARQANQLARGASDIASRGGEVVGQVVHTMGAIAASSKKIADIISVIDGIAFQTNILALNAAVEAARAGEQGRGFAVVAGEVRSLAQRSAAAAKEIKELIGNSTDKVNEGYQQVEQAGATMNEIVEAVKRVTDIMGEISAASTEKSAGIEQVNKAIAQMDETTQQNAALVEEAAAAAESLQDQADGLAQAVSVFRVAGGGGNLARPARALPPGKKASTPLPVPRRQATGGREDEWEEF